MSEDLLYEEIYQKTQDCGRTQFVKLLQQNQIKINQLQQENKELKQKYSKLENKYIKNQSCCNEEDCDLYKEYLNDKNILTEFEKWLQDMYNYIGSTDVSKIIREYYFIFNIAEINVMLNTIEFVAHKLQELKEGKK